MNGPSLFTFSLEYLMDNFRFDLASVKDRFRFLPKPGGSIRIVSKLPEVNHQFIKMDFDAAELRILASMAEVPCENPAHLPCFLCDNHAKPVLKSQHNAVTFKVKQHRRRRNQSLNYHRKVQARWNARFERGDKFARVPDKTVKVQAKQSLIQQIQDVYYESKRPHFSPKNHRHQKRR